MTEDRLMLSYSSHTIAPLDFLQNILCSSDPPIRFGEYFTRNLRELCGAKLVLLVHHCLSASGDPSHRTISFTPEHCRPVLEKINTEYLLDQAFHTEDLTIWHPHRREAQAEADLFQRRLTRNLSLMEMENCIIIPLTHTSQRVGTTLLFGVPEESEVHCVAERLSPLNPIFAALLQCGAAFDEMERKLRERTRQLQRIEGEYRKLKRGIEAPPPCKNEFLANMSHEIRTPMTSILGFADLMEQQAESPQSQEAANTIKKNGKFLLSIMNDILDISRLESGRMQVHRTWFRLQDLVAELKQLLSLFTEEKNLTLVFATSPELPEEIFSDANRLKQVLINVLSHAVTYSGPGTLRCTMSLSCDSEKVPILTCVVSHHVIDTSLEQVDKVFEAFLQDPPSLRRLHGGPGLGLAIGRQIARLLGGEVTAKNCPRRGSSLTISVQAAPSFSVLEERQRHVAHRALKTVHQNQREKERAHRQESKRRQTRPMKGKRILLIEDGNDNRRLISLLLEREGAEILFSTNGEEGVVRYREEARKEGLDLILMDMQMPVLDGYEAAKRIREVDSTIPILALTAHAMPSDREKCLQAGCSGYLSKPIDRRELIEAIVEHLDR